MFITSEIFNEIKQQYFSGKDENARFLRFGQYIHFVINNEYPYIDDKIKDAIEEDEKLKEKWNKLFYTKNIHEAESIMFSNFIDTSN